MSKLWLKHQKFLKGNAGFSLVELIIVIAIMAALVAILAPQYIKYVDKAREQADETAISEVRHICEVSLADEDVYNEVITGSATALTISIAADGTISGAGTELTAAITDALGSMDAGALTSKAYKSGTSFTIDRVNGTLSAMTTGNY